MGSNLFGRWEHKISKIHTFTDRCEWEKVWAKMCPKFQGDVWSVWKVVVWGVGNKVDLIPGSNGLFLRLSPRGKSRKGLLHGQSRVFCVFLGE